MKLDNLIKREISITIVTVLLVSIVFFAFSYAIFKVEANGEKNTITFGDIQMAFCVNEKCDEIETNIDNIIGKKVVDGVTSYVPIYPQKDPVIATDWDALTPYTFTLENTGKLDLYVTLYLEKDANSTYNVQNTIGDPSLSIEYSQPVEEDQIKIAIGEDGGTPTIKTYSETAKNVNDKTVHAIAENIKIASGKKKTFKLYSWLKDEALNDAQGKYFVTQISARGEFIPEEIAPEANPNFSE